MVASKLDAGEVEAVAPSTTAVEAMPADPDVINDVFIADDGGLVVARPGELRWYPAASTAASRTLRVSRDATVSALGNDVMLRTEHELDVLDTSLNERSRCRLPDGWAWQLDEVGHSMVSSPEKRWWLAMSSSSHALVDSRTCRLAALPSFGVIADSPHPWLVSPSGRFLATHGYVADSQVRRLPDLSLVRVEHHPANCGSAKGCDSEEIDDQGRVAWMPRGGCAIANVEVEGFISGERAIFLEDTDVIVRSHVGWLPPVFSCGHYGRSEVASPPVVVLRVPLPALDGPVKVASNERGVTFALYDAQTVVRFVMAPPRIRIEHLD